ncbi:MAG TPA: MFS transporter [Ktedonobacteraceae bacterium]|nr:MFS transporter [Ktedonobacteraceae bacterium]
MPNNRRWLAVSAIGLSLFLSALDGTIVTLALPPIAQHFQLSASLVSAVTLGYAIPLTLLVLPAGDLVGRFRVLPIFLVAVLGFGLGSLLCGIASSFLLLLVGRIIQGCCAALLATQGIAVAAAVVSPNERGRAMGLVGTLAPLGGVAGPGVGGLLLAHFGWSSVFFVNVPMCGLAALLGIFSLGGMRLFDQRSDSAYRQMAALLRRPAFLWGLLAFLGSVSVAAALYYLLPFDLSDIQHLAPTLAGGILLCVPLAMVVMGILGGYLTDRYGAPPFILTGSGLLLIGLLLLTFVAGFRTSELDLAWRLLLIGSGIGLFSGPNQTLLMSVGTRETMGAASALSNLSTRLGSVCGPLVLGITWSFPASFSDQIRVGILVIDALAVLNLLFAFLAVRRRAPAFSSEETPETTSMI